jgi:hypothetical protein
MTRCTRRFTPTLTRPPLTTRETVLMATSAFSATARIVGLCTTPFAAALDDFW